MENDIIITEKSVPVTAHPFREYDHFKIAIRDEINSASESFVKIGYLLKVARDTDILINSGYNNYLEFAREEFSLDAGTVSRFIKINDKYSVDHNTPDLLPEFKGYGRAKLQEMITLPDYLSETFTPELTKSEIQTIKAEYEQEQAVTDLEVMMEDGKREFETDIRRFIYKLFKVTPQLFRKVYEAVSKNRQGGGTSDRKVIMDVLLPGEIQLYITRPEGLGKMNLKLAEDMEGAELLNIRTGEKELISEDDLINAVLIQINSGLLNKEDYVAGYLRRYKERFPEENTEVAPVQPERKKSHVTVAKEPTKKKKPEPKSEAKPEVAPEKPKMVDLNKMPPLVNPETEPEIKPEPRVEEDDQRIGDLLDAQLKAADDNGVYSLMDRILEEMNGAIRKMSRIHKDTWLEIAIDDCHDLVRILEELERRMVK